jgi:non-specific serine/threonine protein kinase
VTALVTSRAVLRVSGERDVPILPLATSAPDGDSSVETVRTFPSVRLFEERAESLDPELTIPDSEVTTVAAICRRLDGLPLAIELAASRSNVLSPSALLSHLDRRMPLLTGGAKNLPERLRTLRDAIAWSYDLLTVDEQRFFRWLAVFDSGCTIETAVALGDYPQAIQAIDTVGSLVDQSLLSRETSALGHPRFTMLETIREFALDMLAASGEGAEVRQRHAEVVADLVGRLAGVLNQGPVEGALLLEADEELANVRSALKWYQEASEELQALRLAGDFAPFWLFMGLFNEGREWLERLLDDTRDAPAADRARALRGLGMLYRPLGDHARAVQCLEECLALERTGEESLSLAISMHFLAITLLGGGEYDRAEALWDEAMPLLRKTEYGENWIVHALHHLGLLKYGQSDLEQATSYFDEARLLHHSRNDVRGEASSLVALSLIDCDRHDTTGAARRLSDALAMWEGLNMAEGLAGCFAATVSLAQVSGRPVDAARFLGTTRSLCESRGIVFTLPERATYDRVSAAIQSELAEHVWRRAYRAGRSLTLETAISEAHVFLKSMVDEPEHRDGLGPATAFDLSPREIEVLQLLVAGRADREIADELYIALRTAQSHVSHVLKKLDARSRSEAAVIAVRHGLDQPG